MSTSKDNDLQRRCERQDVSIQETLHSQLQLQQRVSALDLCVQDAAAQVTAIKDTVHLALRVIKAQINKMYGRK